MEVNILLKKYISLYKYILEEGLKEAYKNFTRLISRTKEP